MGHRTLDLNYHPRLYSRFRYERDLPRRRTGRSSARSLSKVGRRPLLAAASTPADGAWATGAGLVAAAPPGTRKTSRHGRGSRAMLYAATPSLCRDGSACRYANGGVELTAAPSTERGRFGFRARTARSRNAHGAWPCSAASLPGHRQPGFFDVARVDPRTGRRSRPRPRPRTGARHTTTLLARRGVNSGTTRSRFANVILPVTGRVSLH